MKLGRRKRSTPGIMFPSPDPDPLAHFDFGWTGYDSKNDETT
jgi:hypothetical protein